MSNWKHTAAALGAVMTVAMLSMTQMSGILSVMADKQEVTAPAVLKGDGVGETPVFDDGDNDASDDAVSDFTEKTGYIIYSGGSVNVREEASKEAQILTSLSVGDSMQVTAQNGDWYAVTLDDGTSGFVMCDLVSFDYDSVKAELLSSKMYETGIVSVSGGALNVRDVPSENGSVVIDQVANGDKVYIIEKDESGWYKVYFGADYDIGYVMSDYITIGDMIQRDTVLTARKDRLNSVAQKGTIVTNGEYVNVRRAPSEGSEAVSTLKNGSSCTIINRGTKWTKILTDSGIAYVTSSAVMSQKEYSDYTAKQAADAAAKAAAAQKNTAKTAQTKTQAATTGTKTKTTASVASATSSVSNSSKGAQIVKEAEKYIGTKYVYGGSSPAGFDCSGLVQYTMKKVGISVNRSSRDQYKNGSAVAKSDLQAGDLVFFSKGGSISHVGIYAGGGKVIHSPKPGQRVCYTTLDHMCSYSTYVGARRVY